MHAACCRAASAVAFSASDARGEQMPQPLHEKAPAAPFGAAFTPAPVAQLQPAAAPGASLRVKSSWW